MDLIEVPDIWAVACKILEDAIFLTEGGDRARRRIFFLETSRIRTVGARTACAVESASRLHPHWSVHYLHASARFLSPFCPFVRLLRTFRNVRFAYLDYKSHFKAISSAVRAPLFTIASCCQSQLITRAYVAGWLAGDISPRRALWSSGRCARLEGGVTFQDSATHSLRVLLRWCNATRVEQVLDNRRRCRGVTLLPRERLLPLNHTTAQLLFDAEAVLNVSESFGQSYLVHTFHSRTRDIQAEQGSFVERAAAENCPRTFELANRLHGHF
ncbi:hypothetical protein HPB49_020427 [Dermacentor silvarum]|uniref:Uncharacterized protein n=1 Tax=Dermacentor silvarum TaxID=543639 RepID=A0ACB8D7S3_DERSI|nr:hypothetical protein HPB49_020427 [Dermacentor silvarum]